MFTSEQEGNGLASSHSGAIRKGVQRAGAKILVTGGMGFIGRHLVARLIRDRVAVRLLLRRSPAVEVSNDPLVEVVIGDVSDAGDVAAAMPGIEIVYHLAATMRGNKDAFERGTIAGTRNVVEACLCQSTVRLVYMSSLAVIDADAGRHGTVVEDVDLERLPSQRGHYSYSKVVAEGIVRAGVQRGLHALILRPGVVVGPDRELLTPGIAHRLRRQLIVIGNGNALVPLVHVQDVVDALRAAASAKVENGLVVHLVDDMPVTQNDIIRRFVQITGESHRVVRIPLWLVLTGAFLVEFVSTKALGLAPAGVRRIRASTASRTFDCTRAAKAFGWTPRTGVARLFHSLDSIGKPNGFRSPESGQAATV